MTDTTDVDEAAAAAGLTREELLRRTIAGGGAVLLAGNLAGVARAAVDAAPKRGGTFRIGVSGGSAKDFIDGQNIVTRPDQARIAAPPTAPRRRSSSRVSPRRWARSKASP